MPGSLALRAAVVVVAALAVTRGAPAFAQGARPPIIRSIEIDRSEVFDSSEVQRFWGFGLVNALHARTRLYVIRRELLFGRGEPYDTARANESARNLRALSIFRDVEIDTVSTDSGVTVRVRTTDGWTTNLGFGIRTSGAQRVINAFVQEINLLGTRTIATLGYESDPDRNSVLVGFDTPRLISNRVGVGASYSRRSDGHSAGAALNYPFFALSSRRGGSLSWGLFDGRVLHYEEGTRFVKDSAHRKFAIVRADGAVRVLRDLAVTYNPGPGLVGSNREGTKFLLSGSPVTPFGPLANSVRILDLDGELEDLQPLPLARYGLEAGGAYLIRPDHYVAARWRRPDATKIARALARAQGGDPR